MSNAEYFADRIYQWAASQPPLDGRRITFDEKFFHVTIDQTVPITIFSRDLQSAESVAPVPSFVEISMESVSDSEHAIVFSSIVAPNSDELYVHIPKRSFEKLDHDISMYDHFDSWMYRYSMQLQEDHGIVVSRQLFKQAFQVLSQVGFSSDQYRELAEHCQLGYVLQTKNSNRKDRGSTNLALSWQMDESIVEQFYALLSQDQSLWSQAGIDGVVGDWDAFMAYAMNDISQVFGEYMYHVTEAANTFCTFKAPRIVWEETKAFAEVNPNHHEYISMEVFGFPITEHQWYKRMVRDQIEFLAKKEPIIDYLLDNHNIQNLRIPSRATGDEPLDILFRGPHLRATIDSDSDRTIRTDIFISGQGMRIELSTIVLDDKYEHYFEEYIRYWNENHGYTGIGIENSYGRSGQKVFCFTIPFDAVNKKEYLQRFISHVQTNGLSMKTHISSWYTENITIPSLEDASDWSILVRWRNDTILAGENRDKMRFSDPHIGDPDMPNLFIQHGVYFYETDSEITACLSPEFTVPEFVEPEHTEQFIAFWQSWCDENEIDRILEDKRGLFDLSDYGVSLFPDGFGNITLGITIDKQYDRQTINALLTATNDKLEEFEDSVKRCYKKFTGV